MARRDGIILDLCWVHAEADHQRFDDFIAWAQQEVAEDIPGASLSVNLNLDQTEALVKVTALGSELSQLPGVVQNAIIRIYTEADFPEALALVSSVAWAGEPPPRDGH